MSEKQYLCSKESINMKIVNTKQTRMEISPILFFTVNSRKNE